MGPKFFGQYLIEQGEIDAGQLRAALDLMESENLTLGELAVKAGFADEAECRRVNGEQRRLDRPFGELAVQMGVLSTIELEELLQEQIETRVNVGCALVRLESLGADRLAELESGYKVAQSFHPDAVEDLPNELAESRLATSLVEMLPRFVMRLGRIDAVVETAERLDDVAKGDLVTSLTIAGSSSLEMSLVAERAFGRRLCAGMAGLAEDAVSDELCLDALGEFLNVLAGNAMGRLDGQGCEHRLEAPRFGQPPVQGWRFSIVSVRGSADLVLTPR